MEMNITFPGDKKVNAHFKGFTVETDQPVAAGGEGSAPSPFDLFLASVGTCAGFYVLRFCQERGIPTQDLKVSLDTKRRQGSGLIGEIDIEISLPAQFPEKYRGSVKRAADLCAVKQHLENPPQIEISTIVAESRVADLSNNGLAKALSS